MNAHMRTGREWWKGLTMAMVVVVNASWDAVTGVAAQDKRFERPELTVRVSPAKPYLQEQILHSVRLVSAFKFAELEVEIPVVDAAESIVVAKPTVRPFRSYGVEGVVYETSRVLFPETSGTLHIPGVHITGAVLVEGQKVSFERKTEPVEMTIAAVPESYEGDWWLVSGLVEIREEYSQPLDVIRVGDTVRRTVTVSAKGSTAEHVPGLSMRPSRGLTILPGTPIRRTESSAAGVTGILEQAFDITVVESQPVDFGPIRLVWWDSEADAGRRSAARAVRIEPLPRDIEALKARLMARAWARVHASRVSLVIAGVLIALSVIAALFILTSRRLLPHDRALLRVARRSPSAAQAMQAVYRWSAISFPDLTNIGNADIGGKLDAELAADLKRFSTMAFGNQSDIGMAEFPKLADRLIRARQKRRSNRDWPLRLVDALLGKHVMLPALGTDTVPSRNRSQ